MCDMTTINQTVLNLSRMVVSRLAHASRMFSAHDVKLILRNENPSIKIFHEDVKQAVRGIYENGEMPVNYTRSMYYGDGFETLVYHDDYDYASDYEPDAISEEIDASNVKVVKVRVVASPAPSPIFTKKYKQAKPKAIPPVQKTNSKVESLHLDRRSRLCLPAKMIRAIGLKHGDEAAVFVGKNSITINRVGSGDPDYTYFVDKADNIRIGYSVLPKINLLSKINSGSVWQAVQKGNSIVVSQ